MTIFSDRLKELKTSNGRTQKQVAEAIGVSMRAYQYYETDTKEPTLSKLIALADYYGVSLDYLVGRSDNPKMK